MRRAAPRWSYTVSTEARADYDGLVVCCVSTSKLGTEALARDVTERYGEAEGRRWHRARAEEYATRLLNSLRLHLPTTELIVHVEEQDESEKIRVVIGGQGDAESIRREAELAERVAAIRQRTWSTWLEGLQATMASLRRLEELSEERSDGRSFGATDRAA